MLEISMLRVALLMLETDNIEKFGYWSADNKI